MVKTLLEFRPDDGVVGGSGDFTWGHIDLGETAARGQRTCRQYVVDAPAEIALEGIAKEIPVGVLNDIRVKFAKNIDESPGDHLLVGDSSIDVEVGIVHASFGMVDVNRLGGDIEVAKPDRRCIGVQGAFKISAQTLKPSELQSVFLRRNRITLRNVSVDDRNPADDGLDDPEIFVVGPSCRP